MNSENGTSYPLLDAITAPSDLRTLDDRQLAQLSEEIRRFILEKISQTGGHLSPNLGVVELTLALHRVFDSPRDRIIWDVGHQAYVHKLVTGRADRFDQLRKRHGLSGYPDREESPHDFVENSHASTSLSYALGHALAGAEGWTIAVIGDGALTGGMAYEALNHIAVEKPSRLIIVLNDNGRSYAPTVGGLARVAGLAHYRFDPRYEWAKRVGRKVVRNVAGETAEEMGNRVKDAVKQLLEPSTVFDILGLKYSGRIDGHDLPLLEETLTRAREYDEPVIVHVATEKGRGYRPAIDDDVDRLHGVGRFDLSTGKAASTSELSLTQVAGKAVAAAVEDDPDIVALSAAMVSSTGLAIMAETHPDRVLDTGIAEQHTVTLAAGLAMAGKKPIVSIYSTFLQRAFDQLICDVGLHGLNVTFLLDRSGITGPDGPSHHGVFDLSYLRMIPGMVVGAPADSADLCGMITTALDHVGPVAIRFPKGAASGLPEVPAEPIPIGRWQVRTEGDDLLFLANGPMVEIAEKAASSLEQRGYSCGVINARWVKPLDDRLKGWVADARKVVTLEDNVVTGGFGSSVLEALGGTEHAAKVTTLGVPDRFLDFGSADEIRESVGLDVMSVVDRVSVILE